MTIKNLYFALLIIGLIACQPVATEAPVMEATEAASTPTAVVSTPTPLPPTPVPLTPTPIPTANFTPADIIGMWTRSDPDRGTLFLIFSEGGAYVASHGTPEGVVHAGKYTLDGRIFTFVSGWNCSPLGETEGQYILRLAGEGKFLLFDTIEDKCPDRPSALKSFRWDLVVSTPTP